MRSDSGNFDQAEGHARGLRAATAAFSFNHPEVMSFAAQAAVQGEVCNAYPNAAAAAFVMTALAQIAVPPAIGQTIPDSLKQSGSNETAIKEKRNAWTVGVAGGLLSGSYMTFADELAKALDDGDNLRVLPMVTYGAASNVDDLLYLRGVDVAVTQSDVFEYFKTERKIWNLQNRIHYIIRLPVSEVHILARRDIRTHRGSARQEGELRPRRRRLEPHRHADLSAARHPGRTGQYRQSSGLQKLRSGEI